MSFPAKRSGRAMLALAILGGFVGLFALSQTRERSRRLVCGSNLKGLATTAKIHRVWDGLDDVALIDRLIRDGHVARHVTLCPSARPRTSNYVLVPLRTEERASIASSTVVAYEPKSNHRHGGNIVFADGHAAFVTGEQYNELIALAEARRQAQATP